LYNRRWGYFGAVSFCLVALRVLILPTEVKSGKVGGLLGQNRRDFNTAC